MLQTLHCGLWTAAVLLRYIFMMRHSSSMHSETGARARTTLWICISKFTEGKQFRTHFPQGKVGGMNYRCPGGIEGAQRPHCLAFGASAG